MPQAHDPLLLSFLTSAYSSAAGARKAIERALSSAALDDVPMAPADLAAFLRTHLRARVVTDLGRPIADALTAELLHLVDAPEEKEPHPSGRASELRVRGAARIMMVGVEPAEEAMALDLQELADGVLRVRHPLPACERIRVTRPLIVLVGATVRERDVDVVTDVAREAGCEVIALGAFVARAALHQEVRRALARASARRTSTVA